MSAVLVEEGPDKGAVWHFGDPVKEQRALEAGTAWADLSHHEVVSISGPERLTWLHLLTTQDHENLSAGQWQHALILDPNGRIEHQFFLVDDGKTTWIVVNPGRSADLVSHLEKMKFRAQVEIKNATPEYAVLRAPGKMDEIGGPYALVPRAELSNMVETFSSFALQVGTWALDAMRVAAGLPRIGFETDHKSIPNELGLLNSAVHLNKGCYRGQETVAKINNLGNPPRRLVMLHLDGTEVNFPKVGSPVENDGVVVGFLGTVARHHELGPIALAVVKRNTPLEATLSVSGIPAAQEEIVAGK
ncbi:COG0354 Predicted aminomethyltransferase related to GcvT [Candidatus Nanopelagicaceae bacterium]